MNFNGFYNAAIYHLHDIEGIVSPYEYLIFCNQMHLYRHTLIYYLKFKSYIGHLTFYLLHISRYKKPSGCWVLISKINLINCYLPFN